VLQDPRQHAGHHRADTDEEALHGVAGRALRRRHLVADEGTERLHRNIDRGIEQPQHAGGDPQRRHVGEQEQRQRREHCAHEEVRATAPQAGPGAIGQVAHDRLHQQSGQRRGDPQQRNRLHVRAQRLEDAADVGVLQRKAELDAKEAETHVPYLPERELRFLGHGRSPGGWMTHCTTRGACLALLVAPAVAACAAMVEAGPAAQISLQTYSSVGPGLHQPVHRRGVE